MTKIEFQHAFADAADAVNYGTHAFEWAQEVSYFLNRLDDAQLRDPESVTVGSDGEGCNRYMSAAAEAAMHT